MKRDRVLAIVNAHQAELQDLGVKSLELFGSVARVERKTISEIDEIGKEEVLKQRSPFSLVGMAITMQLSFLEYSCINRSKPNTQTLMSPNPFQIKPVSPELLVGRKSEIGVMFDQIANKSHLAIYGGSGIGKSSLLKYASYPQAWHERQRQGLDYSQVVIVSLNCRGINPFTASNFWREV